LASTSMLSSWCALSSPEVACPCTCSQQSDTTGAGAQEQQQQCYSSKWLHGLGCQASGINAVRLHRAATAQEGTLSSTTAQQLDSQKASCSTIHCTAPTCKHGSRSTGGTTASGGMRKPYAATDLTFVGAVLGTHMDVAMLRPPALV
jgi:hypothetical protein